MQKLTTLLIVMFSILALTGFSQSNLLNGPEGIACHTAGKSYFVTNATDGKIIKIDSLMEQSVFYEGFSVPMGCEIVGDSLFVASNDPSTITCINAITGEFIGSMTITQSPSMAHMDIDKRTGFLYVMGQAGQVFKINTKTLTYNLYATSGIPSGAQTCTVDTTNNCLYIFSWPTTFVRSVNLSDSSDVQNMVNPGFGQNIDCTHDSEGYIYVSSWQGNKINKFSPGCSSSPEIFETGFNKPAGLFYNADANLIAVCNYGGNSIDYIELETTNTGFNNGENFELKVYPNPVEYELKVVNKKKPKQRKTLSVYNLQGKEIINSYFTGNFTKINLNHIPSGTYLLKLETQDGVIVKKIIKK